MSQVDYNKLADILAWLAGPAGMVAWVMYWSQFLKNVRDNEPDSLSWVGRLLRTYLDKGPKSPGAVQLLHLIVAFIVPVTARLITSFAPADILLSLQPVYAFLAMFYLAYTASQVWYQATKTQPPSAPAVIQNITNEAPTTSGAPVTNKTSMTVTTAPEPPEVTTSMGGVGS